MPNRIRELRLEKRLTQADLAEAVGVKKLSISRWENGQSLKVANAQTLADFFSVSVTYLLGLDDNRQSVDAPSQSLDSLLTDSIAVTLDGQELSATDKAVILGLSRTYISHKD